MFFFLFFCILIERGNVKMKPIIVVMRKVDDSFLVPLQQEYEVLMSSQTDQSVFWEQMKEVSDRVVALWTTLDDKITGEMIEQLPNLKVIANMAVGYNNIDLAVAQQKDIIVCNTPDVLSDTTADLAFGLLMMAARQLPQAEQALRRGEWKAWEPFGFAGLDIHGSSLGIIGMGRIGQALAKRATGFDMTVKYHNRNRKPEAEEQLGVAYATMEEILKTCQFVAVFSPLTPETKGMIGREQIAMMREDAVFINAARGEIVDEQALYEALRDGKIYGAGLDVFEKEPITKDHPLLSLPNVVALPHMGSASIQTRTKMAQMNVESILAVLNKQEPVYTVQ